MRWKVPRPHSGTVGSGGGPADTATVVIGIDGLPTSWDAFCWACREARQLGGRAVAVFISSAAAEQAGYLLADLLCEAGDLDLTFIDAPGDPVAELLRIAREVHADLLVVGSAVGPRLVTRRRESVIAVVPPSTQTPVL
jgi:nucleotide-binding universal stress UspA family protein